MLYGKIEQAPDSGRITRQLALGNVVADQSNQAGGVLRRPIDIKPGTFNARPLNPQSAIDNSRGYRTHVGLIVRGVSVSRTCKPLQYRKAIFRPAQKPGLPFDDGDGRVHEGFGLLFRPNAGCDDGGREEPVPSLDPPLQTLRGFSRAIGITVPRASSHPVRGQTGEVT